MDPTRAYLTKMLLIRLRISIDIFPDRVVQPVGVLVLDHKGSRRDLALLAFLAFQEAHCGIIMLRAPKMDTIMYLNENTDQRVNLLPAQGMNEVRGYGME